MLSHISTVAVPGVPSLCLHHLCPPVSPFPLSILYQISDDVRVHQYFCCFPCLIFTISHVSATFVVVHLCLYYNPHHIVICRPMTFTAVLVLHLCHVSVANVYGIPAHQPLQYSLNPQYLLLMLFPPASQPPPFFPHFHFPVYFTTTASHYIL